MDTAPIDRHRRTRGPCLARDVAVVLPAAAVAPLDERLDLLGLVAVRVVHSAGTSLCRPTRTFHSLIQLIKRRFIEVYTHVFHTRVHVYVCLHVVF